EVAVVVEVVVAEVGGAAGALLIGHPVAIVADLAAAHFWRGRAARLFHDSVAVVVQAVAHLDRRRPFVSVPDRPEPRLVVLGQILEWEPKRRVARVFALGDARRIDRYGPQLVPLGVEQLLAVVAHRREREPERVLPRARRPGRHRAAGIGHVVLIADAV